MTGPLYRYGSLPAHFFLPAAFIYIQLWSVNQDLILQTLGAHRFMQNPSVRQRM